MEKKSTYIFAAYEIDQAFGGSEEGGWWYSTGELRRVLGSARMTEAQAFARRRRLNCWLDRLQSGLRETSSMAYDGGRYSVMVYDTAEEIYPQYWPEQRPHYE
jgi:hypothetical protein